MYLYFYYEEQNLYNPAFALCLERHVCNQSYPGTSGTY